MNEKLIFIAKYALFMPLQWKIYCGCSAYLLFSGTVFLMLPLISLLHNPSKEDAFFDKLCITLLLGMLLKAVLSLKSVRHYRNGTIPKKWESRLIQISFCVSAIAICSLILISLALLIGLTLHPSDFLSYDDNEEFPFRASAIVMSILLATFCTVFINALDISVLKAIREKYYEGLILAEDSVNKLNL